MTDPEPKPPRPTGRTEELTLEGLLLCWYGDAPSVVQIIAGPPAVVLFTCIGKLEQAVTSMPIPFTGVKQVTDGEDFLASVPHEVEIIIDPWVTAEGRVRYLKAPRE